MTRYSLEPFKLKLPNITREAALQSDPAGHARLYRNKMDSVLSIVTHHQLVFNTPLFSVTGIIRTILMKTIQSSCGFGTS